MSSGFEPFGNYKINSSWEAAKGLRYKKFDGVNLILKEIPVSYEKIKKEIPHLWGLHKPKFVIHCGMSRIAKSFVLEKKAYNNGYELVDNCGYCPPDKKCVDCGPLSLETEVDVDKIAKDLNNTENIPMQIETSKDAGRYLCEFTYYTSLNMSLQTLFVHIPPLNEERPLDMLTETLYQIILATLQ